MHHQPLQDVVPASQVDPPHPAGLIQMSKGSLRQFAAQLLQPLVAFSPYTPPILIGPLLLFRLALALPLPPPAFGLGYVTPDFLFVYLCQYGATVVPLIGHHLFYSPLT